MRIKREEKKFRSITKKSKDEPKNFYRFISGKFKQKVGISKLWIGNTVYKESKEQAKLVNIFKLS